ncbi:Serine--tRNA ligase, mitochondrial [Gnomoniopsis sp. IMI 355080]|nr:Serine--tRNA ligase, mitochondrial [Gnomoniopsis sp. IMI 355080]
MNPVQRCLRCRLNLLPPSLLRLGLPTSTTTTPTPRRTAFFHSASRLFSDQIQQQPASPVRPTTAPKPVIDVKHIRQNPSLYEQTCLERNYPALAPYPQRIIALHEEWQARQREGRSLRERSNLLRRQLANPSSVREDEDDPAAKQVQRNTRAESLEEARLLKAQLSTIEADEARLQADIHSLALALPNLTSPVTPRGDEPLVLSYINDHPEPTPAASDRVWRSHVHIGTELGLLDFAAAGTASGWGWYYLLDEGAQLEQALVSYALATATKYGWRQVSPPTMVYSHIAAACGFQPRDAHGETQVYAIAQSQADRDRGRPELCMTGTAEIALAGMHADSVLDEAALPSRRVAVSRCYRAEAGARGADTKGLYRVHEFTKVELFAWTRPGDGEEEEGTSNEVFEEMVDMQIEILSGLGLHCRVLEMPSGDLGASAARKNDIEAWFPSRARRDTVEGGGGAAAAVVATENKEVEEGWGEVTSASICTDYQTRRLGTRVRIASEGGKMSFPWTVNGTAMAVPRVLAAILENGWDEAEMTVTIPEVLRPWMEGKEKIGVKHRLR